MQPLWLSVAEAGTAALLMYVVLGGGFIGTALCERLMRSGAETRIFSSSDCDLRDSASVEILRERLGSRGVDGVVLCASKVRLKGNSFAAYCDNIAIATSVARLLVDLRPRKLVFFSTVDVYGDRPTLPIGPESPLRPFDFYGSSKLMSEAILSTACDTAGISRIIFRLAGVFGPTDRGNSAVSKMVDLCTTGRQIRVSNAGRTLRDYVFIDDLVGLAHRALSGECDGTFNAVSGNSRTVLEIVETIVRAFDVPCRIVLEDAKAPRDYDLVFDQSAFSRTFGDVRFTALAEALSAYKAAGVA